MEKLKRERIEATHFLISWPRRAARERELRREEERKSEAERMARERREEEKKTEASISASRKKREIKSSLCPDNFMQPGIQFCYSAA